MRHSETALDEYGFVTEWRDWDEHRADAMAHRLGVQGLGTRHRAVIAALRRHFARHRAIPPAFHLCRELDLGDDCLDTLFGGPLVAWKVAGLPNPGEEARVYLDNETRRET